MNLLGVLSSLLSLLLWVAGPVFVAVYSAYRRHSKQGISLAERALAASGLVILLLFATVFYSLIFPALLFALYTGILLNVNKANRMFGVGADADVASTNLGASEPVQRTYIRVKSTSERPRPEDFVDLVHGLQNMSNSFGKRYNPLSPPPKIESLILKGESNSQISFLIRPENTDKFESVFAELKSKYPNSYDIRKETVNFSRLILPDEVYSSRYNDRAETDTGDTGHGGIISADSDAEFSGSIRNGELSKHDFRGVDVYGVHWYGKEKRRKDWMTYLKRHTQQTKRQRQKEGMERRARSSPLSSVIEEMTNIESPVALQVVFQRRRDWERRGNRRKKKLENGTDSGVSGLKGVLATLIDDASGDLSGGDTSEGTGAESIGTPDDTGLEKGSRASHITKKILGDSFKVNIRCLVFTPEEETAKTHKDVDRHLEAIADGLNDLSGPFYKIAGRVITDTTRRKYGKHPDRADLLQDFLSRNIRVTLFSRTKLQFVMTSDELANYLAIPSIKELSQGATRGMRTPNKSQRPLPLPNPKNLSAYTENGMAVGLPLNENRETMDTPVRVPPDALHHHYLRAAVSGSGKSTAGIHEILSLAEDSSGPQILIEPKGGSMADDYLRSHYAKFGSLDDVIYIKVTEQVPAMPLFDIRPNLAAGDDRVSAVQNVVSQFNDIMRLVMGVKEYEKAKSSVNLLKILIAAKFDKRHGADAFTLKELQNTLSKLIQKQKAPHVSQDKTALRNYFQDLINSDEGMFEKIARGAEERLQILSRDDRIEDMFNYLPDWNFDKTDHQTDAEYPFDDEATDGLETVCLGADNAFHFYDLIFEDKTIIFDVGDLNRDMTRVMSLVVLGYLWNATKMESRGAGRSRDIPEDFVISCLVEEAKELSEADLLTDFLAWGREFNICLGLVTQYPDQLASNRDEVDVYEEIMQNTGTKIFGELHNAEDVASLLEHDTVDQEEFKTRLNHLSPGEWITQVKSPGWFDFKPMPFSVKSQDQPSGHPEGPDPLSSAQEIKYKQLKEELYYRSVERYCIPPDERSEVKSTNSSSIDDNEDRTLDGFGEKHGDSGAGSDQDRTDTSSPDSGDAPQSPSETSVENNSKQQHAQEPSQLEPQKTNSKVGAAKPAADIGKTTTQAHRQQDATHTNESASSPFDADGSEPDLFDDDDNASQSVTDIDDLGFDKEMNETHQSNPDTVKQASNNTDSDGSATTATQSPRHTGENQTDDTDSLVEKTSQSNTELDDSSGQTDPVENMLEPPEDIREEAENSVFNSGNSSTDSPSDGGQTAGDETDSLTDSDASLDDSPPLSPGHTAQRSEPPADLLETENPIFDSQEPQEDTVTTDINGHTQDSPDSSHDGRGAKSSAGGEKMEADVEQTSERDTETENTSDTAETDKEPPVEKTWGPNAPPTQAKEETGSSTAQSESSSNTTSSESLSTQAAPQHESAGSTSDDVSEHQDSEEIGARESSVREPEPARPSPVSYTEEVAASADPILRHISRVSNETIDEYGLELDHIKLLAEIYTALAEPEKLPDYSLTDSMLNLEHHSRQRVETLLEAELIEQHIRYPNKSYFNLTPEGRQLLGVRKQRGPGEGDLGEKAVHRVYCHLIAEYIDHSPHYDRAERYVELDGVVFDVVSYKDGTPVRVFEIETESNNRKSMVDDYQKMANQDATSVWVMQNREIARDVIEVVKDRLGEYSGVKVGRTVDELQSDLEEKHGDVMLFFGDVDELMEGVESS